MTTLADINQTLAAVVDNTNRSSNSLDRFIRSMEQKRGDDLEAERERKAQIVSAKTSNNNSSSSSDAGKSGSGFSLPTALLTGAALKDLSLGLAKGLLKRGLPAALATAFADDIGKWVNSKTGSAELGAAAERATLGGTFGLLLGKKFGLIGAAVGGLATEENIKQAENLGNAILTKVEEARQGIKNWAESEQGAAFAERFGSIGEKLRDFATNLPAASEVLSRVQTGVGDGLEGLTGLIEEGTDSEKFQENMGEAAGVLGAFAFFFRGPIFRVIKRLAKFRTMAAGIALVAAYKALNGDFTDGDLTTEDIGAAAGVTTALAIGATKAVQAVRRGRNSGARTGATTTAAPPPSNVIGKVDGKNVVRSNSGKLAFQGVDGKATTNVLSEAEIKKLNKSKWWSKFPRLTALKGIPGTSLLFAAIDSAMAASIMLDETKSREQKISELGPLIGGSVGTLGFGALGLAVGGPFGATLGALGGYFGGGYVGTKLAEYLLGKTSESDIMKSINADVENSSGPGKRGDRRRNGQPSATVNTPRADSGVAGGVQTMTAQQTAMAFRSAGSTNIGQVGDNNSNNTNVSQSQPLVVSPGGAIDFNDMVVGSLAH
jgi:hypothetical protein